MVKYNLVKYTLVVVKYIWWLCSGMNEQWLQQLSSWDEPALDLLFQISNALQGSEGCNQNYLINCMISWRLECSFWVFVLRVYIWAADKNCGNVSFLKINSSGDNPAAVFGQKSVLLQIFHFISPVIFTYSSALPENWIEIRCCISQMLFVFRIVCNIRQETKI